MTTRTAHTMKTAGRTATGLIAQANRAHQRGRGRRIPHRKGESDGSRLAPIIATWWERHSSDAPRFITGKAQKPSEEADRPFTEKGKAALAAGGRIRDFPNGARIIFDAKGHIAQNLRSPSRGKGGTFTEERFTRNPKQTNLEIARKAIDAFFGKHEPSQGQLQGAIKALKLYTSNNNKHYPDDLNEGDF